MEIESLILELEKESQTIKGTIKHILKDHTSELDNLIEDISETLKQVRSKELQEYPYNKLELDFAELTTEIYKVNRVLAELGGTSDIAKSKREIAFSRAYLVSKGNTIKEKESLATLRVENEDIIEKVYSRVLKQLKLILDSADNIHLALKRMHSARMLEMEVFRKEVI